MIGSDRSRRSSRRWGWRNRARRGSSTCRAVSASGWPSAWNSSTIHASSSWTNPPGKLVWRHWNNETVSWIKLKLNFCLVAWTVRQASSACHCSRKFLKAAASSWSPSTSQVHDFCTCSISCTSSLTANGTTFHSFQFWRLKPAKFKLNLSEIVIQFRFNTNNGEWHFRQVAISGRRPEMAAQCIKQADVQQCDYEPM